MTTARTPELNAVERAQLDAWEAAAYSEDSLRERMAQAMCEADVDDEGYRWVWDAVRAEVRDRYRRMADAVLSVVRTPVKVNR